MVIARRCWRDPSKRVRICRLVSSEAVGTAFAQQNSWLGDGHVSRWLGLSVHDVHDEHAYA